LNHRFDGLGQAQAYCLDSVWQYDGFCDFVAIDLGMQLIVQTLENPSSFQ
jgi:hypothetical protein